MTSSAFNVSDWGFFRVQGPDAKRFLQGLVTADLNALAPGGNLPSCVLTPKGLLIADFELYMPGEGDYLAVTRPAAAEGFQRAFENKILLSASKMTRVKTQAWLVFEGAPNVGLEWTGLARPARLVVDGPAPAVARQLTAEEFHVLRIEAGFPWYGADLTESVLPLEGRLDAAVSMTKGCYMGQETVSRLVHRGHVNRILVGLDFIGATPTATTALNREGKPTGHVTSAAGRRGLGLVRVEDATPGTKLDAAGTGVRVRSVPTWPKPLALA